MIRVLLNQLLSIMKERKMGGMKRISIKVIGLIVGIHGLNITSVQASEWLCAAIGGKTISIVGTRVFTEDKRGTPTAKLSDVSKIGGRFSDKHGSFDFENLSYYESDDFIEFMGQKIKRRNDGSISIMEYYDFSGFKSEKMGKLVVRVQNGGASTHYHLRAYQCDALK
jgi:hypothetical protein